MAPPIVINIPDASADIPSDCRWQFCVERRVLDYEALHARSPFTEQLFAGCPGHTVVAPYSPLLVDTAFPLDAGFDESSGQIGTTSLPTHSATGERIRISLDSETREVMLQRFYYPHQHALDEAVTTALKTHGRCLLIEGYTRSPTTPRGPAVLPPADVYLSGYPDNVADTTLRGWVDRIRDEGYTAECTNERGAGSVPKRYQGDSRVEAFCIFHHFNSLQSDAAIFRLGNLMEDLTCEWHWQEIEGASTYWNDFRHYQRRRSQIKRQLEAGTAPSRSVSRWWHDAF